MTTTTTAARTASAAIPFNERESLMLKKRVGSTDFIITVRFNQSAKETIEDKILKLIESEVRQSA